ncbi:MAG: ABC transporter permease [Gammaproteobacteria bacterium]|nr:ABC transporter permease [Gammaproteobacteria bacterium]
MTALAFALRLFRRDWRNAELRLLAFSLMLAVAAVTAVGFFTDRVSQAMELQAGESLSADLVISSHDPISDDYRDKAAALGLDTAETLGFPSAVIHGDRVQMVVVKAVSPGYPLRGALRVRATAGAPEQEVHTLPRSGEIWADAQLLAELDLATGGRLSLGEREFRLANIISRDIGEASSMFSLGPGILIGLADIPSTGLVTPASRVHHRLLLAGEQRAVAAYRQWAEAHSREGVRITHMSNARPALRSALDRGSRFLALAALVTVLIASAAVALSSRRFVERQADTSAVLRCLGASRPLLLQVLLIRLLLLALAASLAGVMLGFAAQFVLSALVGEWFNDGLPIPGIAPLFIGIGTGLVTLLGFTLPPALRLGSVPPLRVLRRDLNVTPTASWILALCAFAAMALLMLWQAGELKLALLVLSGTLAALLLLLLLARVLITLLTPLRHHSNAVWRYGLAGLARNPVMTSLQMAGFGLGILALLLLTLVRVDLLSAWERTIPTQAPNQFLINIQPESVAPLQHFLTERTGGADAIYPMLRARLIQINERKVSPESYRDEDAQRMVAREFNLSYAQSMQPDNRVVAGRWWRDAASQREALYSVEEGIAKRLGIKLDDSLTFDLAGNRIGGRVSNIRSVQWDSFRPNFFVIATPGLLRDYPTSYITSFYLAPGKERTLSELIRNFPEVTAIDVGALMEQIREIMARGSAAIEYVFLFTLAAGVLVLYAGIQASREHRRQESAILRTLGLKRSRLLLATGIEFMLLGLLAGALASLCASITGWVIADELFALDYRFNPWLWLAGTLGGSIGVGIAGVAATYPFVVRPPLHTLRTA